MMMLLDPAGYENLRSDDNDLLEALKDLHDSVSIPRYFAPRTVSAGRHADDTLNSLIFIFPEKIFQMFFRMKREGFWKLVVMLGPYWEGSSNQTDTTDVVIADSMDVIMAGTWADTERYYNLRSTSIKKTCGTPRDVYE